MSDMGGASANQRGDGGLRANQKTRLCLFHGLDTLTREQANDILIGHQNSPDKGLGEVIICYKIISTLRSLCEPRVETTTEREQGLSSVVPIIAGNLIKLHKQNTEQNINPASTQHSGVWPLRGASEENLAFLKPRASTLSKCPR